VILSDVVVEAIRKELRRQTAYNGDPGRIGQIIREAVLRPELL
jgi:hypothetical protein